MNSIDKGPGRPELPQGSHTARRQARKSRNHVPLSGQELRRIVAAMIG